MRSHGVSIVREDFLQTLQPDFTHLTSLFDGFEEDVATSAGQYFPGDKTAITLYDLIPLVQSARYLTDNEGRDYYASKIQNIKNKET